MICLAFPLRFKCFRRKAIPHRCHSGEIICLNGQHTNDFSDSQQWSLLLSLYSLHNSITLLTVWARRPLQRGRGKNSDSPCRFHQNPGIPDHALSWNDLVVAPKFFLFIPYTCSVIGVLWSGPCGVYIHELTAWWLIWLGANNSAVNLQLALQPKSVRHST